MCLKCASKKKLPLILIVLRKQLQNDILPTFITYIDSGSSVSESLDTPSSFLNSLRICPQTIFLSATSVLLLEAKLYFLFFS